MNVAVWNRISVHMNVLTGHQVMSADVDQDIG